MAVDGATVIPSQFGPKSRFSFASCFQVLQLSPSALRTGICRLHYVSYSSEKGESTYVRPRHGCSFSGEKLKGSVVACVLGVVVVGGWSVGGSPGPGPGPGLYSELGVWGDPVQGGMKR